MPNQETIKLTTSYRGQQPQLIKKETKKNCKHILTAVVCSQIQAHTITRATDRRLKRWPTYRALETQPIGHSGPW
jgi:surface antigen